MPIQKRTIGNIPYTQIPNSIFDLGNSDAIAVWCYLYSKPENWLIRRTDVMKSLGLGRTRYDKAINLLKEQGLFSTAYSQNPETGKLEGSVGWLFLPEVDHRTLQKPTTAETDMSISASLAESDHLVIKDSLVKKEKLVKKDILSSKHDDARELLNFLNQLTGRNYRPTKNNLGFIAKRLEDYTAQELKTMVARKTRDWKTDPTMNKFLRPMTLFNATKCDQYVGECV